MREYIQNLVRELRGEETDPRKIQQERQMLQRLLSEAGGLGEAALSVGSGMVGEAVGGLAGAYDMAFGQGNARGARDAVQEAMTYQPRTETGQRNMRALGDGVQAAMDYKPLLRDRTIGEDLQAGAEFWDESVVPGLQQAFGDEAGSGVAALGMGVAGAVGLPGRAARGATAGQRISTRLPTAVRSLEDPLAENLIINTDAMRAAPEAFKVNTQTMAQYPQLASNLRNPDKRADHFVGQMSDNLLDMYDRIPPEIREMSKEWYVGANKLANEFSERYNKPVEAVAGVMAALSPQKDWYMNASLAERVIDIHQNPGTFTTEMGETASRIFADAKYQGDLAEVKAKPFEDLNTRQKAMFIRTKDEAHNERGHRTVGPSGDLLDFATTQSGAKKKTGWGSLSEISKAVSVLEDPSVENISKQMGGMHKVRNFYNNIVDPMSDAGDVTIDTHAVAAGLLSPYSGASSPVVHNFGGVGSSSSAITGAQGTYGIHADAYRKAAKEAGVLPREMQSITWEGVRGLFPAVFKTKGNAEAVSNLWSAYKNGDVPLQAVRDAIYDMAGGIDNPTWLSSSGAKEGARSTFKESGSVDPELLALLAAASGAAGGMSLLGDEE